MWGLSQHELERMASEKLADKLIKYGTAHVEHIGTWTVTPTGLQHTPDTWLENKVLAGRKARQEAQ